MFSSLTQVYSNQLKVWINGINTEIEILNQTVNPIEFQNSFFKFIFHIIYFDSLLKDIEDEIRAFINLTLKFSKDLGLPQPQNFILDNKIPIFSLIDEIEKDGKGSYGKGRHAKREIKRSSYFFSMIPFSSEAYELFNNEIENIEKYVTKYSNLVFAYQQQILDFQKKAIIEIESLLPQVPPPTPQQLYPLLQNLVVSSKMSGKISGRGTDVPQLGRLQSETFKPFLSTIMRFFNGQDKLYTHDKVLQNANILSAQEKPELEEIRKERSENNQRGSELKDRLKKYAQTAALEPKVLETLTKMDPEFPVFLPRLAELIEEEKELTESALKFVLQRSPDIGKYDSMSQVLKFSKPEEAHSMIDNLLQSYKDRTFEELIVLLEKNDKITQHERTSLVTFIYNQLEAKFHEKIKAEEKLDLLKAIDVANEQGVLNDEEKALLHKFRKRRNELVHDNGAPLSSDLILSTNNVLKRL